MKLKGIPVPILWGDGVHNDLPGLEAFFNDKPLIDNKGLIGSGLFEGRSYPKILGG